MTRTRTWDPVINSHLLYRLSYHGIIGSPTPEAMGKGADCKDHARRSQAFVSAHQRFNACNAAFEHLVAGGKRQPHVAWRTKGGAGHQGYQSFIEQLV